MTQSPPKAVSTSRPPPGPFNADGGRRITALAAGGSVLLLSATAVALWPRTYGTEAGFVLNGDAKVGNPVSLAGRIEAALLEREELTAAAMDLPPELRSPDPIGRLRAGIRVQSRGGPAYAVEFRGSDPQSVQRIANRLVERAVALAPRLAAPPPDPRPEIELAARTRAVTDFLTAHPEMTLDQAPGKVGAGADSGLEALRTEKRQIELRLSTGATDNPYTEPGQDPELLGRRLTELKLTIARREAALKQPRPAIPPAVSPELTTRWRSLLADLASAQARAVPTPGGSSVTARVTARAALPSSPLTPNRLVLSIVAALLSVAAAMVAYVLPRKPETVPRSPARASPAQRSEPPGPHPTSEPPLAQTAILAPPVVAPPEPIAGAPAPPSPRAPIERSDPPPAAARSEPPGGITVQRTVVLGGTSASSRPPAPEAKRSNTDPGGLQAPHEQEAALANTALAAARPSTPPVAPLFGSRPPPGAGSYSVSSSHPPPIDVGGGARTSVERLSPLQSQRPPAPNSAPVSRRPSPAQASDADMIVSRPPALDPEAERWAAHFETPPPGEPAAPPAEESPKRRSGRWKTQVMGSMVPLEVIAAREERPPGSAPRSEDGYRGEPISAASPRAPQPPAPAASTVIHHDVPSGWRPNVDPTVPEVAALCEAVLKQATGRRLCIAVTGTRGSGRAQIAAGLALALAQNGPRVLLLEADFDGPDLHQALAVSAPAGAGFSQQLAARRHNGQPKPWIVVRCSPNLHVLTEGRLRSPGLNASDEFERAIQELREQHHLVIIHAPSLDKPAELRRLGPLAQAVVTAHASQPPTIQFGEGVFRALL